MCDRLWVLVDAFRRRRSHYIALRARVGHLQLKQPSRHDIRRSLKAGERQISLAYDVWTYQWHPWRFWVDTIGVPSSSDGYQCRTVVKGVLADMRCFVVETSQRRQIHEAPDRGTCICDVGSRWDVCVRSHSMVERNNDVVDGGLSSRIFRVVCIYTRVFSTTNRILWDRFKMELPEYMY